MTMTKKDILLWVLFGWTRYIPIWRGYDFDKKREFDNPDCKKIIKYHEDFYKTQYKNTYYKNRKLLHNNYKGEIKL